MKKGLGIFIIIFLLAYIFPRANAQGDKLSEMTRIRVNGTTVELDSQSATKILSEVNKYLGQESVVIQPRKAIQPVPYSWKIGVRGDTQANLSEVIRVVVANKPVIDSQVRSKLTSAIMEAVQAGKKVEIMPRDIHKKMLIVEEAVRIIVESAEKGRLPDSKQIGIGSTLNNVISQFGEPLGNKKMAGLLPKTTQIFYMKDEPNSVLNRIDFVYSNKQKQVIYLTTDVSRLFRNTEPLTDHDLFKILGTPYKTRQNLTPKEMAKAHGLDDVQGLTFYPVHTFKVGNYFLHFSKVEISNHVNNTVNEGNIQEVITASIDETGESQKFLFPDGTHPAETYNQSTPCWIRK